MDPVLNDLIELFHGSGGAAGAGAGQGWWSTSANRAASYGPNVVAARVPREVFEAGAARARQLGSGTAGDAVLTGDWFSKARPVPVQPPVTTLKPMAASEADTLLSELGVRRSGGLRQVGGPLMGLMSVILPALLGHDPWQETADQADQMRAQQLRGQLGHNTEAFWRMLDQGI